MLKPTDWRSEEGGVGQRFRRMCALIGLNRSRGARGQRKEQTYKVGSRSVDEDGAVEGI